MPFDPDYIDKLYGALKSNVEGFTKSPTDFRSAITSDTTYRNKVYAALQNNVEGFTLTPDIFNKRLGYDSQETKFPKFGDVMKQLGITNQMPAKESTIEVQPQETLKGQVAKETGIATEKKRKSEIPTALENTANLYFKNNGITPTKIQKEQKINDLKTGVENDHLIVGYNSVTGEPRLERNVGGIRGFLQGAVKGFNEEGKSRSFIDMNPDERIKMMNEEIKTDNQYLPSNTQYTIFGGLGESMGQGAPMMGKAITGAVVGGALAAAAPETGGFSLEGIAPTMAFLFSAPGAANVAYMNELKRRYAEGKQNGLSDYEAYQKASNQALVSEAVSLATNAFLSKIPATKASGEGLNNALKEYVKSGTKATSEFAGTSAAGTALEEGTAKAQGFNKDKSVPDILAESLKSGGESALMGMALHVVSHPEILVTLPKYLQAQIKGYISKADKGEVSAALDEMQQKGISTPEGISQAKEQLTSYDQAATKVPPNLDETTDAVIKGLIEKKNNLEAHKKTLDPAFHEDINNEIDGINQKIDIAKNAENPLHAEVDANGNTLFTPKPFEELSKKEIEGIKKTEGYLKHGDVEAVQKGEGENKTFTPKATFINDNGKISTDEPIKIEGDKVYKDQDKALKAAEDALAKHYYENKMPDNLKPENKNAKAETQTEIIPEQENAGVVTDTGIKSGTSKSSTGEVVSKPSEVQSPVNAEIGKGGEGTEALKDKTFYHSSKSGEIGKFDTTPIHFSENKEYSAQYGSGNTKEYKVNIESPFDTATDENARKIYNEEFLPFAKEKSKGDKRYEPLKEGEKIPFTTSDLLYLFLRKSKREGKDYGYDGVVVDEKINNETSVFPLSHTQIEEIKSQPTNPIEDIQGEQGNPTETEISKIKPQEVSNAITEGQQPESNLQQHKEGDGGGETTKTSSGNRNEPIGEIKSEPPLEEKVNEGGNVPPEQPPLNEAENEDNSVGGIAQRIREKRAETTGVLPSEIGQGWNKENALARGRELIANGVDPYQLIKDFKKNNRLSADDMAVFQAQAIELQRATDRAADSGDTKAYENALFKENNFLDDVKKAQTEWSKTGLAQQGEYNFDAESFNSIKRAKAAKTGKPQADLPPEIKASSERVKALEEQNQKLQKDLEEALNKKATETEIAKKKTYTEKAKKVADTFRKLKTKPFTFKDENGNDIPIQIQGISWNDLIEVGAKAIEKTGEIADGVAEILDKIKDAEWYAKLSATDKEKLEKQLSEHYEYSVKDTPEAKNIKRLEKQLENLQQGIAKQSDAVKRKLSEREKELQDQIFDAKKNLGLVPSKELPKVKVDKTSEQKKLDRLTKELEDLQQGKVRQQSISTEDTQAVKDLKDKIFEEKQKLGLISSKGKIPKPNYGLTETPESKNIRRLEKELDDARNGKFKDKAENRTLSQVEKDLQDQIFEEKKKAGLIRSKEQSIRETDFGLKITAEEKRIEALQKQKEDLENGIVKQSGSNKLNPTPEQKAQIDKLNDDIAELKKNLGLTRSRMAKPEDAITPEERNIDRLNQELDRLKAEQKLKGKPDKRELTDEEKDIQKQIELEQDKIKYNNLVKEFAGKKDNSFTPEQSSAIWDYAKKAYIEPNPQYHVRDMVNGVAMDLGLKPEQVRNALGQTSETKRLSDQIYRINYEKNKAKKTIQNWVNKTDVPAVNKFLENISSPFRSLATLGHGHALLFTHAGMNLFDPQVSKEFLKAAANQFKLVYGKESNYAKAVEDLKAEPLYNEALRAGVGVDPDTVYDDWQLATNFLKKFAMQGNKGFLVLKKFRMELFKNEYNHLSAIEKADPKVLKQIAGNVNHWTGTAGIKPSALGNAFIFAPNLIVSKFARLTSDPLTAINVLQKQIRGKEVSLEDKAAAKIIAKKTGRILATYIGALAANSAMLALVGSKQKVNFTNPNQSDWLEFKTGDAVGAKTVDVSSGMTSTMQFLAQLALLPFEKKEDVGKDYYGAKNAQEASRNLLQGYLNRSLSPAGSVVMDELTHKDYAGNVLPWFDDKPTGTHEKLTVGQYAKEKLPIPVAETFKTIHDEMVAEGVDEATANHVIGGIIIGAIASAGVKVGNAPKERPSPFTEEDNRNPTFKYFLDKGLNLPNTSLQYEKITNENNSTEKSISDFPKEKQDEYQKVHKERLKYDLEQAKKRGYVYVADFKDAKGNPIKKVSFTPVHKNSVKTSFDKLTEDELVQVLYIAQSSATEYAKDKVFSEK